jgi:hypothetical protein
MENILDLYSQEYDPKRPLVCIDERPCQLLGEVAKPMKSKRGRPKREDYEYERKGTCCAFMAFEPLSGWRFIEIKERRTKVDYAHFLKELADKYYPDAECIRVVQDNLNTHSNGSFYEAFPAKEAFRLARRFEYHYTPKKASWLNMVEIELSALSRQCLHRRIPTIENLKKEVLIWERSRNKSHKTVNWKFTKNDARIKLSKFYPDKT